MSVLPIDIQTVIAQMGNVSKLQHNQAVAGTELQRLEYLKDSKELNEKDEQINELKKEENREIGDALDKENSNPAGMMSKQNKDDEESESSPAPDPSKGKIIDTIG